MPVRSSGEAIKSAERPSKVLYDKVLADEKAQFEVLQRNPDDSVSTTSLPSLPSLPSKAPNKVYQTEVSPMRDYQKVPNSIPRNMILFKGKSKQVWDYLWSISRGAITPVREIRKSRKEIKEGSALGSFVTLDAAIKHLEEVGLIKKDIMNGSFAGNVYEIFMPEEIPSTTSLPSLPSSAGYTQKVAMLAYPESGYAREAQIEENKGIYMIPKTSLKTEEKNDDELARRISAKLRETHGRELTAKEKGKMDLIRDAVAEMLGTAFGKAETISDAVSFALEHLHRLDAQPRVVRNLPLRKKDEVGRHDFDREAELVIWQDILADGGVVEDFEQYRTNYSAEDWQWLMSEIVK